MTYASPDLMVIGRAEMLVLGGSIGADDRPGSMTQPPMGLALGLDD